MPLLSIVIPCYNMGYWLPTALESCLWQTHKNIEVIVVNDGSTDETQTIAEFYAKNIDCVSYHRQPNKGIGEARKKGQELAKGDFILWLDAEDVLSPVAAENMLRVAIQDNVDFVCGNVVSFSDTTYYTRSHFPHPEAHKLTFTTSPNYWKSTEVWRWIFSLPYLKKGKRGRPFIYADFKFGLSSACFMFDVLSSGGTFSQCLDEIYYFRKDHKKTAPSIERYTDEKLVHYLEVKRILLAEKAIKPFIRYINEEYWKDLQIILPHMNTQDVQWFHHILEVSFEIFSGLSIEWFTDKFLYPEVREASRFIEPATAFIKKDKPTAMEFLLSLAPPKQKLFPEGKGLFQGLRGEVSLLFYNRSRRTKALLKRLNKLVHIRLQNLESK